MKVPPYRMSAPASRAIRAARDICSPLSTAPGPATTAKCPPPNAAPEDLEKVVAIWPQVLENLESGLLRGMLKDVPPEYKADGNDTKLYLRLKNFGTKAMEHKKENVHNIETVIEKKIGKHVDVVLLGVDDKVDGLYKVTVSKNENVDDIARLIRQNSVFWQKKHQITET